MAHRTTVDCYLGEAAGSSWLTLSPVSTWGSARNGMAIMISGLRLRRMPVYQASPTQDARRR